MGRIGSSKHMKRFLAVWPVPKKIAKWTVKPMAGPHPAHRCLPLAIVLRDILKYADNAREVKTILNEGKVKVDGKIRRDYKFPVGLMDVVEIIPTNEKYRVILNAKGEIMLNKIEDKADFKLCRIENKTTLKNGNIQLNLHDGKNILIKVKDPKARMEDVYNTGDVLKISLPQQQILSHLKFENGSLALIIDGVRAGKFGEIQDTIIKRGPYPTVVSIKDSAGSVFQTIKDYVFVIGKEEPTISLPEVV
ncbi:MAG: 30S ribosomal protein S4e [Euryarchaeota archaeon]|nr:30S ribosomal protein S4e [Euryarchaeota archaeon]